MFITPVINLLSAASLFLFKLTAFNIGIKYNSGESELRFEFDLSKFKPEADGRSNAVY